MPRVLLAAGVVKGLLLVLTGFLLASLLHFALHEVTGCAEAPLERPAVERLVMPVS